MSEPIVRLTGKKVDLCILMTDPEFVELYTKWYNDETIGMWVHGNDGVHSIAESQEWADNANKDGHYNFTVCVKRTYKGKVKHTPIGTCSIGCYGNSRNASLGILLGEQQSKGYGTEVIAMLIKFAFEEMNAHRLELNVCANNERAIRCYTKNGFKECGRKHEAGYFGGKYRDVIQMEILEQDYRKGL